MPTRTLPILLALLLSATCYGQSTTSLEAHWKLDESSGNATDSHGSNTLTDTNSVGTAAGKVGTARDFENGSNQCLTVNDNASLSTGNIDFTICGWFQFESEATDQYLVSKYETTGNQREYALIRINSTDRLAFRVSHDGTNVTTVSADNLGNVATGTWYFVVCWHDATNDLIGIQVNNGTADTAAANASGVFDGTSNFAVGRRGTSTTDDFDGLADEVSLFKRLLTANEKTALYNSGNGRAYPWGAVSKIIQQLQ